MAICKFVPVIALLLGLAQIAESQAESSSIRNIDFQRYLTQRDHLNEFLDCPGPSIKQINIEFGKLLPGETEQAVVEATTCAIVSGGADIVEVFKMGDNGVPQSLPIDDSSYRRGNLYEGKSWTPRFQIINGKLTRWFVMYARGPSDSPKVGYRRQITYVWSGSSFVIEQVSDIPPEKATQQKQ